jgi:hypothetical protein
MTVLIEHESFVEAGAVRVGFDESGVGIGACHFSPSRDDVIVDTPPRGNGHVGVGIILDVWFICHHEHAELVF